MSKAQIATRFCSVCRKVHATWNIRPVIVDTDNKHARVFGHWDQQRNSDRGIGGWGIGCWGIGGWGIGGWGIGGWGFGGWGIGCAFTQCFFQLVGFCTKYTCPVWTTCYNCFAPSTAAGAIYSACDFIARVQHRLRCCNHFNVNLFFAGASISRSCQSWNQRVKFAAFPATNFIRHASWVN